MIPSTSGYEVRFEPLPDLPSLQVRWTELEHRSACSIFLSWFWIGAWLAEICPLHTARLATVHLDGRCVAMAVFTVRRRFPGLGPRHLRLHETGNRELDSLTIEYNGVLSEKDHESAALAAVVRCLAHRGGWLTLHLPGLDADAVEPESLRMPTIHLRQVSRPTFYVDLADLAEQGLEYASSVTAGTRAHIRRTARKVAALAGTVTVEMPMTVEQRRASFATLVSLHQAHWGEGDEPSGAFTDPQVLRFHHRLIASSTAAEGVQLLSVRAGSETVGCVYGLAWRGIVYFYQAGIDYRRFGDCGSPGLFILSLAVQHALDEGRTRYEFMAGDAPYKKTLANAQGRMLWLSLDRTGPLSQLRRMWWSMREARG